MTTELIANDNAEACEVERYVFKEPRYVERFTVNPLKPCVLDLDSHMGDAADVEALTGIRAPLVCGIYAAGKEFAVLDTRCSPGVSVPVILIEDTFTTKDGEPGKGYKGLRDGEVVTVGQGHHKDRFTYPETVSRKHFSIEYDQEEGALYVYDKNSTNGTTVSGYILGEVISENNIKADYTSVHQNHLVEKHPKRYGSQQREAPYGYYYNHPIIGRNSSSVRNGVYGTSYSEMILVDDKSNYMRQAADTFINSFGNNRLSATLGVNAVLKSAEYHVSRILKYDIAEVDKISKPLYADNELINLSEYIDRGVGVCRHQALLAAHLIEEAIDRGLIMGSVGVERNRNVVLNSGHAWAVYRSDSMNDIVVDPAQGFVGTRDQASREGRWDYELQNVD
jgi:hypothetical protein